PVTVRAENRSPGSTTTMREAATGPATGDAAGPGLTRWPQPEAVGLPAGGARITIRAWIETPARGRDVVRAVGHAARRDDGTSRWRGRSMRTRCRRSSQPRRRRAEFYSWISWYYLRRGRNAVGPINHLARW